MSATMVAADMWEIMTAVGTLAAVVAAVGIAAWPAYSGHRRRPKFELTVSNVEPHCIPVAGTEPEINIVGTVHLRVAVHNTGRGAATGAWVRLTRRWRKDLPLPDDHPVDLAKPAIDERWGLEHEEPVALRWAANPAAGASTGTITVAAGQTEFVELATLEPRALALTMSANDPAVVLGGVDIARVNGRHRWELYIGADGVTPSSVVIEFVIDGRNFISAVTKTSVPAAFVDRRLFRLLARGAPEGSIGAGAHDDSGGDAASTMWLRGASGHGDHQSDA